MRVQFIFLISLVSGAICMPEKGGKFSIFNVVAFPNEICTAQEGSKATTGVCYSEEDCSSAGGTPSGPCASGFGVCCVITVSDCTSEISQNVTHILNENAPEAFKTASKNCKYTVTGGSDICQLRLDFDKAVLTQPNANGLCDGDTLTITSPTKYNPPTICGSFAGTHMYVETGMNDVAATISINTGASSTFSRTWSIRVTKIDCFNPLRAPTDCLQYFTKVSDEIQSFNVMQTMITNQKYDICIRQALGMCSFEVSQARETPDSFSLGTDATMAKQGADCTVAFVQIGTSGTSDRYCGQHLSVTSGDTQSGSILSDNLPFRISVATTGNQIADGGFDLTYIQRPCY